ncbi:MAG: OadG family protein [Clostridia bacterium]|nr:OadG family protein [Clostridia bacterium]
MLTNVFMNVGALAVEYTREEINEMLWQVPLLGMLMVFSVLAILWGVLTIFKLIFVGKSPKAQKPQKEAKTEKTEKSAGATQNDAELMAVLSAAVAAHQSNDEIIAVLTAAVSAYRASEGETSGFRVVAFKRQNSRAWNRK